MVAQWVSRGLRHAGDPKRLSKAQAKQIMRLPGVAGIGQKEQAALSAAFIIKRLESSGTRHCRPWSPISGLDGSMR
jgi:hypothetical protein